MRPTTWILCLATALCLHAGSAWSQSSEGALQAVIDALETSRQLVIDETPEGDGTARAEGMRHLLRQIEMNLAPAQDDVDTAHPGVFRCPSKICKLGFDNPDNVFVGIGPMDDQHTYRVFGFRGTADLITFQLFEGPLGGGATLTSDDLEVGLDGSYELFISPSPQPGDWMQSTPLTQRLIVRVYLVDWDTEREPSMQIEVLGEDGSNPIPHVTPQALSDGLAFLSGTSLTVIPAVFQAVRKTWLLNDLPTPIVGGFGLGGAGFPSNHTSPGRYQIAPDEALLVEVDNTPSRYQDLQLGNIWLESLDYSSRQVALNRFQAYIDDDNVIRYVLAHTDPGVSNWLDVSGHPKGTMFMRFLIPDPANLPTKPNVQLVPLANVTSLLPPNHPVVTPEQRAQALASRRRSFNRRTNPAGLEFELLPKPGENRGKKAKKKHKRSKRKFKKSDR